MLNEGSAGTAMAYQWYVSAIVLCIHNSICAASVLQCTLLLVSINPSIKTIQVNKPQ